uniref:RNA-directed DNA polymerase n=1 Tax=Sipha flava TaxID=143950 RepID=A0A2S2QN58_9HEMI
MSHVDALSRAPVEVAGDTEMEVINDKMEVFTLITEEEQVMAVQRTDTRLKTIVGILHREESGRSVSESALVKGYVMKSGLLFKEVEVNKVSRKLWVVPNSMRKGLVVRFHDLSGHFSVDRTVDKIMECYYFPRMRRYVRLHIQCCPECVLTKVPRGRQPGSLHPITLGRRQFEILNLDHLGSFIKSTRGNQYVLVMIDNLTKYVKLYAVRSCGTEGVITSLGKFILQFGIPRRIISDRGTAYTSKAFGEYCTRNGIKHTLNSVRHPQANGQVERVNGTLLPVIQNTMETDHIWDKHIDKVECNLNNAYNKTIGNTPFHVLYGYFPSFKDGVLRHVVQDDAWEDSTRLQERVRERIAKEHELWKLRYDTKHSKPIVYKEGDIVYIKRPPKATDESPKLQPKYRGPLFVTQVLPNDVYGVSALRAEEGRQYATTVHVSQMKSYHLPDSD